jgi:deoxyribonuclease-4
MYIGSHVSIRGGYLEAAKTAHRIGARAFQYFPKNPRSLTLKSFDSRDAEKCARYCEEQGLLSIGHAPYPVNLAVEDPDRQEVTRKAIFNALEITDACGSVGLVVHFGKIYGKDPLQGYKNIIQLTNKVLGPWHGKALMLLENLAGEGVQVGTTLEELVNIRKLTDYPEKIGFCFDTCHAFASGLWTGRNWDELERKGRELGYFDHLKAVHLNDSVYPSGARKDRHANVGKGQIGEAAMKRFLRSTALQNIPVVLETSAGPDGTHRQEIAYVKQLAASVRGSI